VNALPNSTRQPRRSHNETTAAVVLELVAEICGSNRYAGRYVVPRWLGSSVTSVGYARVSSIW
jgi:hypothetical protein